MAIRTLGNFSMLPGMACHAGDRSVPGDTSGQECKRAGMTSTAIFRWDFHFITNYERRMGRMAGLADGVRLPFIVGHMAPKALWLLTVPVVTGRACQTAMEARRPLHLPAWLRMTDQAWLGNIAAQLQI
jgi:hypothetical protein